MTAKALLLALAAAASALGAGAAVALPESGASIAGDRCLLIVGGDERLEVEFSGSRGIVEAPVTVRVDGRELRFGGFYAAFNGETEGYRIQSVQARVDGGAIRVTHRLEHPRIAAPLRLEADLRLDPETRTLAVRLDTENGSAVHLDRLGLRPHSGAGIAPRRMWVTKFLVLNAPIEPFKLAYNYNCARFWCFTMQNGLTEMVGTDSVPRGFDFDAGTGTYDIHTYCDPQITYTFAFTGKGPQEAIARYRSTIRTPAPPTLSKLPGRVTVMTGYPIRERYQDFLEELTGRGVRDFIWLAYAPWPGDRELVEPFGALYSIYDMYTDLFPEGPRKAEGWKPEWVRYDATGRMKRGYWDSTRCLPQLYIPMAAGLRRQGTLGREMANRNFLRTPITELYNLSIFKKKVRPSAVYLDVHASLLPEHYWDSAGRHYPPSEHMRQEKAFFEWTRRYMGNVPVYSEVDTEPFAGIMDAGIFSPWPAPEGVARGAPGIRCASWEYYPFLDQVHRERLLNSGAGAPFALPDYNVRNMGMAIQFGRPQVISAYPGTSMANVAARVRLYYLSSAYHKMLGLSRMERVDFDGDSIHRQVATYSNGTRIWSNRGSSDWQIEGMTLPQDGYLIRGKDGFQQYRVKQEHNVVEAVLGHEYQFFAAERRYDFGPIAVDGAVALRVPSSNRLVVYEIQKPRTGLELRLGKIPGMRAGRKLVRASILLTRGRKVPLRFPDVVQDGDTIRFGATEMATNVGYEIELKD